MAIIPLRAYNREIEGLIDNGQLDEAVAHCRHVLATFPKHIATYRLLGKAHLEQQRISDATDIFQRVLSAIPDDFIANLGMSIIREDENNLDASIWHMELAYEAQPSNVAIQDELRRLYGRRDGVQPPKVRLTRGALSKMYAKGGLFDQAIAELRAAINEDPNRPDLQLLLAQMFFQISQRVEAVESCVAILKKLPFCLSANQILAVCLPEGGTSEGSKNYRQVAISMDPYFAFASADSISSDLVADNSVNIEKLEWKPGIQLPDSPSQPAWATSLGISIDKPASETIPDWLKEPESPIAAESEAQSTGSVTPFVWDTQEVERIITEPSKEEEIPDWMKDSGWIPATEETIQSEKEAGFGTAAGELEIEPDELAKADLPEWLLGIAPAEILDEKKSKSTPPEKDTSIPWLEQQEPGPTDTIIQWLDKKDPETNIQSEQPVQSQVPPTDEDVPEWLKDLDVPHPSETTESAAPQVEAAEVPITPAFTDQSFLDEPPIVETEKAQAEEKATEDIVDETAGDAAESESLVMEEFSPVNIDELPDWIKELAAETSEEIPSLKDAEVLSVEASTNLEEPPSIELSDQPEAKLMPSEQEIGEEISETDTSILAEEQTRSDASSEEEDLTVMETVTSTDQERPAGIEDKSFEDELKEAPLTMIPAVGAVAEDWKAEEPGTEESISPFEDEAETTSAIPAEEIPDWIKGLGETPSEPETVEESEATNAEEQIPQAEELPSWLAELDQPEIEAPPTEGSEALEWKEDELPDWIKEITESAPAEVTPANVDSLADTQEIIVQPETEPGPEEPISAIEAAEVGEPTAESAESTLPDWLTSEVQISDSDEQAIPPSELEKLTWEPESELAEASITTPVTEIEPVSAVEVNEPIDETQSEDFPTQAQEAIELELEPADGAQELESAREAFNSGKLDEAVKTYSGMIKHNHLLSEVIKDLQEALDRFPVDINLWLTLGDAHLMTSDYQEALNTYTKAEDLVR